MDIDKERERLLDACNNLDDVMFRAVLNNQGRELFAEFFSNRGVEINIAEERKNLRPSQYTGAFRYINNALVSVLKETHYRQYTELVKIICDCFVDLCLDYDIFMTVFNFSLYSGISESQYYNYKNTNPEIYEYLQQIRDNSKNYIRTNLSGNNIGLIALANNDNESKLMYNNQNIALQQTESVGTMSIDEIQKKYLNYSEPPKPMNIVNKLEHDPALNPTNRKEIE